MRIIFIYLLLFSMLSCSTLEKRVVHKLKNDDKSYQNYLELCNQYEKDSIVAYDIYLKWYNQGDPLARLFEFQKLSKFMQNEKCDSKNVKFIYNQLVSKPTNYINDERRKDYFHKFLENYYILPPTN